MSCISKPQKLVNRLPISAPTPLSWLSCKYQPKYQSASRRYFNVSAVLIMGPLPIFHPRTDSYVFFYK